MKDLSMHILDIAENSVRAGARRVFIEIEEDTRTGVMSISVADDGRGMHEEELARALDPFYTSKEGKKTGLGLPLLKRKAEECGGSFEVTSTPGEGTAVFASMDMKNIDCPPAGDMVPRISASARGIRMRKFDIQMVTSKGAQPS